LIGTLYAFVLFFSFFKIDQNIIEYGN